MFIKRSLDPSIEYILFAGWECLKRNSYPSTPLMQVFYNFQLEKMYARRSVYFANKYGPFFFNLFENGIKAFSCVMIKRDIMRRQ